VQHARLSPSFEWPIDLIEVYSNYRDQLSAPAGATTASPKAMTSTKSQSRRFFTRKLNTTGTDDRIDGIEELSDRPVVLREQESKVTLFSWLSQATFDFLKSESGKTVLEKWIHGLDLEDAFQNGVQSLTMTTPPEPPVRSAAQSEQLGGIPAGREMSADSNSGPSVSFQSSLNEKSDPSDPSSGTGRYVHYQFIYDPQDETGDTVLQEPNVQVRTHLAVNARRLGGGGFRDLETTL